MNCEKFSMYLDNYESLTVEQKLEMTVHASECESCKKELDFMLSIISITASLPKIEPPADFMDNLNILIDAEEKKRQRAGYAIFVNVRKNWQKYSAAAACFALVAVITANSDMFIKNMTDDTQSGNNVIPVTTQIPSAPTMSPVEDSVIVENVSVPDETVSEHKPLSAQPTPKTVDKMAAQVTTPSKPTVSSTQTDDAVSNDTVSDNAVQSVALFTQARMMTAMSENVEEVSDYGIATASLVHETSPEGYVVMSRNMPELAYSAEEIQENYSLAEEGSIARGNCAAKETAAPEKAIGKLKISANDVDKAMSVIELYSYGFNGEMYSTNSASLSMMLYDLSEKGVDYTNYIPSYDGEITFQLVIG